ncbi:G1/S-specific cyclin D [Handroanthus impetiginosus]|uniref:G1/S-specific cyclin D n=1 Tax=Handroanthus impetiginosus TaxID=429701 RepID=A0A2G9GCD7_9LAMI|nr:G1/S-specific cyclin D [Handroanthus impetiginosus]
MAENKSFDCGATDLLCKEETNSFCFDGGDFLEPFNGENINGRSDSEPLILLPCLSEECIGWMFEREREHLPRDDYLKRLRSGEVDMSLRKRAFDWMIKACAYHNFGELCLCLAMSYLDRFLSVYNLHGGKTWAIQLVAVACLSLAAKFDEVNLPSTVDLQAGEPKYMFEGKTIQKMEILVLNFLKWNVKPYTPFNFIEYFLRKMNDDLEFPLLDLITRSIRIILSKIKGIDFLEFRPSEIAAAVAVYVSGEKRAMDIDKALKGFVGVEKGRVLKCLELIQDLISTSEIITTATSVSSSEIHSPNGVLDVGFVSDRRDERTFGSCLSSSSSDISPRTKRRRLDQTTGLRGGS